MSEKAIEVIETKFWPNVAQAESCWLWTGAITTAGYGSLTVDNSKTLAHRFSYEMHRSAIPSDRVVDHICRVRNCVNPDHLRLLTNGQNVLAGIGVTAVNARKTHCSRGHELDQSNVYAPPGRPTERQCRTCRAIHDRRYKDRLIAQRAARRMAKAATR